MLFNGVNPCTLHPGISIAKEIPPGTVESQLETMSGSTGEIVVGRTIKQGEYIVRINIAGKYKAQAWEIRKLLAGWACAADVETHRLVPTHWPDVAYDALLKEISPPEFVFGFATVDVTFTVPRPIARDVKMTTEPGPLGTSATFAVGGTSYTRPVININTQACAQVSILVDDVLLARVKGPFGEKDSVSIYTEPPKVTVNRSSDSAGDVTINEQIDYTVTDFERLAKAFRPGDRVITCPEAYIIALNWRNEWL